MRILVTGAGGILGTELVAPGVAAGHDVVGLSRAELDVTDRAQVERAVRRVGPDAVIHAAAFTAVDRAEDEPERALEVNRDGTANVARAAAKEGAAVIYVGTDFIFDGTSGTPYRTDAAPRPMGVYGATKLAGERAAAAHAASLLVVRTSWVYGAGGGNFVDAILRRAEAGGQLRVVADQTGRPTWARNLAVALIELLEAGARGTLHVADAGAATWYDLARAALDLRGLGAVEVTPVTTEAWGAPAPRPRYSVLDTREAEVVLGRPMEPWREALARYLGEE